MHKHGTALSIGQFAELTAAAVRALPRQLSPEIVKMWASNGIWMEEVLLQALSPPSKDALELPDWKTLRVVCVPARIFMKHLEKGGVSFTNENPLAIELLEKTDMPHASMDSVLVRRRIFELGFDKPPTTVELYNRIKEIGSLCDMYDAFFLAEELAKTGEFEHESVHIAAEPVAWKGTGPMIPILERRYARDTLSFALTMAPPEWTWSLEGHFAFRKNV